MLSVCVKFFVKKKKIKKFKTTPNNLIHYTPFVDDSHARFNTSEWSLQFLDILNSQDPSIQCTIEFENENKQFSFLNVTIRNTDNNSHDFKIFWKTSITNVQIKPHSNIGTHIAMGVFKGFFHEHTKYVLKSISKVKYIF